MEAKKKENRDAFIFHNIDEIETTTDNYHGHRKARCSGIVNLAT